MKHIILYFLILLNLSVFGQQTVPEGRSILKAERLQFLKNNNKEGYVSVAEAGDTLEVLFETIEQPKFIYNLASRLPLETENFKAGRVFLVSFDALTEKSSEETGEAKLLIQLKQSDSYKDNLEHSINISSHWQRYYLPFESTRNISKDDLAVVLQYGFSPQSFRLKNINVEVFEPGTALSALPKTAITYAGMEADAAWRKAANDRIERIRKGDFQLKFTKDGKPVPATDLEISLVRHAFPFGAMLHADSVLNNPQLYDRFKDAFSLTVLGNDLKIKRWAQKRTHKKTLNVLTMLNQDGITVKGHVLMWPGFQYNTDEVKANKNNPEAVKKIVREHMYSILDATKGKVSHWDVVNETYTNKDFQNLMGGEDFLYEAFEITKERAPEVRRFTNEYGIISKGGIDEQKQQWYYEYIKRVDAHVPGAVQGVGIQSHMGSDLTPPEKVLSILSYYATLGKPISISEFTMDVQEPEIRERYTRDFMRAAFSHPNVSEFMFWGFEEDDNRKVDIYKQDGSVGAMGKAYFSLIREEWHTEFKAKTNAEGLLYGRGFYGLYVFKLKHNGKELIGTFKNLPGMPEALEIQL